MERFINVAGAQTGPIARNESRQRVVSRLIELMRDAKARGADIVVFPELALTTFFPRWWMEDDAEIDSFFDTSRTVDLDFRVTFSDRAVVVPRAGDSGEIGVQVARK